jgi:hypothetical protein
MGAPELLYRLRGAGLVLTLTSAGGLHVAPRKALTDEHRAAIRAQRDALVLALQTEGQKILPQDAIAAATNSVRWLLHYTDRDSLEVTFCPEVTHAEILERHPDAVAAEPLTPTIQQPSAPMTSNEEAAATVRDDFAGLWAGQMSGTDFFPDDRRTCDQCANLIARRCQAAKRGEIVASRNYEPIRDLPRRCEGYAPGADDPDRRHGRERWPGLTDTKGGE